MKEEIIICACSNLEHMVLFWKDETDTAIKDDIFINIHLTTRRKFFSRLWYGLKYAFGYKCRYGCWDEFIFSKEEIEKLKKFLQS